MKNYRFLNNIEIDFHDIESDEFKDEKSIEYAKI